MTIQRLIVNIGEALCHNIHFFNKPYSKGAGYMSASFFIIMIDDGEE